MKPTDASGIARVVGFYEYANALNNFDKLVNYVDDVELAAIDEIVAERDEYTVFVTAPLGQQAGGERRGIAWVMALARLELASMLATLTNTPSPFQAAKPTKLEFDAYVDLLLEGARAHYEALSRDPALERVTQMSPAQPTVLAYARRLVLARSMLTAAMHLGQDRYTPSQWQQMAAGKKNLDQLQAAMILKIQLYLRESQVVRNISTSSREFQEACGALLRAEQRELSTGQASVRSFRD